MKKLLSILASVGLMATASTSVVSCTKKDTTPMFRSISDIKEGWSFTADNEVIPERFSKVPTADALELVKATIANRFKNPIDVLNELDKGYEFGTFYTLTDSNENTVLQTSLVSKQEKNTTSLFTVKFSSQFTKFNLLGKNKSPFDKQPIDLTMTGSNLVISSLNKVINAITSDSKNIDNYPELEKQSATLMNMNYWLFNQLSGKLEKSYTPGLDEHGARYQSIAQQIFMSFNDDHLGIQDQLKNGIPDFKNALATFNQGVTQSIVDDLKSASQNKVNVTSDIYKNAINNGLSKSPKLTNFLG